MQLYVFMRLCAYVCFCMQRRCERCLCMCSVCVGVSVGHVCVSAVSVCRVYMPCTLCVCCECCFCRPCLCECRFCVPCACRVRRVYAVNAISVGHVRGLLLNHSLQS